MILAVCLSLVLAACNSDDERCVAACEALEACSLECDMAYCNETLAGNVHDGRDWHHIVECAVYTPCDEMHRSCLPCRSDEDCSEGFVCIDSDPPPYCKREDERCVAACEALEACSESCEQMEKCTHSMVDSWEDDVNWKEATECLMGVSCDEIYRSCLPCRSDADCHEGEVCTEWYGSILCMPEKA